MKSKTFYVIAYKRNIEKKTQLVSPILPLNIV